MHRTTNYVSKNDWADHIKERIDGFMAQLNALSYDKRDLLLPFAGYLRSEGYYDQVFIEYYVPQGFLPHDEAIWESPFYVDLVLEKGREFFLVALHYLPLNMVRNSCFGETIYNEEVLDGRADVDDGLYNTWKNVRRMEVLKDRFASVAGGLVLVVTNDDVYLKLPNRPGILWDPFSLAPGQEIGGGRMKWVQRKGHEQLRPSFDLDNVYRVSWKNQVVDHVNFYYTAIEV